MKLTPLVMQPPLDPELTWISLKQHHSYHQVRDVHHLQCDYGAVQMNPTSFQRKIRPAFGILSAACAWAKPTVIRWADRLEGLTGLWNHVAHFDDCFTGV